MSDQIRQPLPSQRPRAIRARERLRRALELRAAGKTNTEIAAELGVSRQAIHKALRRADQRALDGLAEERRVEVVRQVDHLRHAVSEALDGFERSKGTRTKRKQLTRYDRDGNSTSRVDVVTAESRDGNPAFLQAALSGLEAIRRLLGVDAPQRLNIGVSQSRPLIDVPDEDLREELRQLLEEARNVIDVTPQ